MDKSLDVFVGVEGSISTQKFSFVRGPRMDGFVLWVNDTKRYHFTADDAQAIMDWLNENVPMENHLPDDRDVAEHLAELDEMHIPS